MSESNGAEGGILLVWSAWSRLLLFGPISSRFSRNRITADLVPSRVVR
jgi:hypothetical protein